MNIRRIQNRQVISDSDIKKLIDILNQLEGENFTYKILNFNTPAICLMGEHTQKTLSMESAKQILKNPPSRNNEVLDTIIKLGPLTGR